MFNSIVEYIYDALEEFNSTMVVASGRALLDVLKVSLIYLVISIITEVFKLPSFIKPAEAILATLVLFVINVISNIQRRDIDKFRQYLKNKEVGIDD